MPNADPIDIRFLLNSEEFKKMADDISKSVHGVTDDAAHQSAQLTAQIDAFFKNLTQSLKGAFSDVKLDALSKQLEGVDDAGKRFSITLDFIKKNLADLKLNPDEAKEFSEAISNLQDPVEKTSEAIDKLADEMAEKMQLAGLSVKNLEKKLTELRENEKLLQAAVKNAHDPGLLAENKKILDELLASERAITRELEKRRNPTPAGGGGGGKDAYKETAEGMKSQADQARMLQGAMRGLFGAMTSAMVATQMLGGENKRMTETMTTLMSVYAVIRGAVEAYKQAQQVGNVVLAFSEKLFRGQAAAATTAAAATEAQAVATEGARVATVGLNTAIKANPIGLIITAIVAVTTAIITWVRQTKTATEKQKELNDALLKSRGLLREVYDLMHTGAAQAVEDAKNAIALAQSRGASETEILALKRDQLEAERDLLNLRKGENLEDVDNLDNNRTRLQQLLIEQNALEKRTELNKAERKQLDAVKADIAVYRDRVQLGEEINKGIRDNTAARAENAAASSEAAKQEAARAAEAAKANTELARRNAVAAAEARSAAQIEGTAEWLRAELAAIDTREKADIASARAAGETIVKIQQDAANARLAAEQRYNQQQLTDRISAINAQLSAVKKGTLEEMQLRIDAIRTQADMELAAQNISAAKRTEIEAKVAAESAEIRKQYNEQINEADLKARESNINAALTLVAQGSAEELRLRQQLLELRTLMEVQQAQKTINNEQELQAKITEIYARNLVDRQKLQKDFFENSLNDQLAAIDREFDAQKAALLNQSNNSPIGTRVMRDNQELLAIQVEINREARKQIELEKEFTAARKQGGARLIAAAKALAESEANTKALEDRLKVIKNQKLLDQFSDVAGYLNEMGQSLSELGNQLSELDEGLGDTVSTIGQLANAASDVLQGLATGNPVGIAAGVVKAVSSVISIFNAARESEKQAMQELKKYQDDLIKNEIAYTSMMRERARVQSDITKETVAELNARKAMLDTQKSQAQQDYDRLLAQIQQTGQQIVGEHTKKYGGILGIGRKTKVVQDFAALTGFDFDDLERLFTEGKLDDATAAWFKELQKVRNELDNITDATADAEDQLRQVLTGTTADSIADSIMRGFENGKIAIEDFADDFETLIKQAILSSIQVNTLRKPLENFYNQFASMAESGNKLDMQEVQALQSQYNAIIQQAAEQFQQLQSITGVSFGLSNQPGLAGAISRTITEDTANELAGLTRGQFDYIRRQYTTLSDSLIVQRSIEANTANMVVSLNLSLIELQKITVNTRDTNQSVRDMGL